MKQGLSQKIVGGLLFGALVASSASAAFAATTTTATNQNDTQTKCETSGQRVNPFESVLTKLVAAGTITQAKADAMKTYMDANKPAAGQPGGEKKGVFANLVEKGILTEAQQTKLEEAMQALHPPKAEDGTNTSRPAIDRKDTSGQTINREKMETARTTEMKTVLDKLVADSVMTQATADAVSAQMAPKGMFDELVQKGTLTQDQATKIEAAMKALRPTGTHEKTKNTTTGQVFDFAQMQTQRTTEMRTILDKLVADSFMTQATADAVTSYMADQSTKMQQQRANDTADKAKNQDKRVNILDAMVTKGIITEADKTAIDAAVKASFPKHEKQVDGADTPDSPPDDAPAPAAN